MTRHTFRLPVVALAICTLLSLGLTQAAQPVHAAAGVTLARTTVPQGAVVPVTGGSFNPGDTVTVYVDVRVSGKTQRAQATTTANGNGDISTRLSIPRATDAGYYTVTAKDTHGASATTHLTVLPLLVLRVGTSIASATVQAHRPFYIDALGFAPNESVKIQATFPNYSGNDVVSTRTATSNAGGNVYEVTLSPPNGTKVGWSRITATGVTSNKSAQGRAYVAYHPFISLKAATVSAGASALVDGRGFVSHATVRIQITINSNNGSQTLSVDAATDGNGNFTKYIRIPTYANAGTYTVVATDALSGIKAYARVKVATAQPQPQPKPTYRPSVAVEPGTTLPNEFITFTGNGYPANVGVTVTSTIDIRGGGNRSVTSSSTTDSKGTFTVAFRVPYLAAPGTYNVTGTAGKVQATAQINVLPFSAHPRNLNFQWVSLWYHTVQHGTYDQLVIQSTLKTTLGIWVHVIFPSGQHYDYYTNTNGDGNWSKKFTIPRNSISKRSNQAYIALQLWHGKQTTQSFVNFTIV